MSNYFIAIGGSGSKVLESWIHLCAAGLMPNNEDIHVLIVDPDGGNGNLDRASKLFEYYMDLNQTENPSYVKFNDDIDFMKSKVSNHNLKAEYSLNDIVKEGKNLRAVLELDSNRRNPVVELYRALYTSDELQEELARGFKGHPAIGAAVFANNLTENNKWDKFVTKIREDAKKGDVKVFLAGSIFGGTGAAGVPNIAKLIKADMSGEDRDNGVTENIVLGGGLVLPYFYCKPDADTDLSNDILYVTSEEFLHNTQAALKYYDLQLKDTTVYNSLYLVGSENDTNNVVKFFTGAGNQKNDAHIVDLYTAMGAMHFFAQEKNISEPKYYYSGYKGDYITWDDLPAIDGAREEVANKIKKYITFALAYKEIIHDHLCQVKNADENNKNKKFFSLFSSSKIANPTWYINFRNSYKNCEDLYSRDERFYEYVEKILVWMGQICKNETRFYDSNIFDSEKTSRDLLMQSGIDLISVADKMNSYRFNAQHSNGDSFGALVSALYECC